MQLIKHTKNFHSEKYKCQFEGCEKTFAYKSVRDIHFKTIHLKVKQNVCILKFQIKIYLKEFIFYRIQNIQNIFVIFVDTAKPEKLFFNIISTQNIQKSDHSSAM